MYEGTSTEHHPYSAPRCAKTSVYKRGLACHVLGRLGRFSFMHRHQRRSCRPIATPPSLPSSSPPRLSPTSPIKRVRSRPLTKSLAPCTVKRKDYSIRSVYWDTTRTGRETCGGGTGRVDADMADSGFTGVLGTRTPHASASEQISTLSTPVKAVRIRQ